MAQDGSIMFVSGPGVLARFDLASSTQVWSQAAADVWYHGVAAQAGMAFVAGRASAGRSTDPGPCGAFDDVGGIEQKILAGVHDSSGNLVSCESQVLYPYSGFEFYYAAATAGGKFFAAGHAQQSGVADGFPFVLARYDADGLFETAVTEPDLVFGTTGGCCTGESVVFGLGIMGDDLLAAGASRLPGSGEDDVLRPMVMRYTTALTRTWKARSPDRVGRFNAVAGINGDVYAVGQSEASGFVPYLIEKYDASGTRLWSVVSSAAGILTGVAGVGSRVFAVGTSSDSEFGGSDAFVVEVDSSDGSVLSTIWLGGGEDDSAAGVRSDGNDLWVAGTTRSYPSPSGNQVGEADLALWRIPIR